MTREIEQTITKRTTVQQVGRNFAKFGMFYDVRTRFGLKCAAGCDLCRRKFERDDMTHLAFTSRGNKVICDDCLKKAEVQGVLVVNMKKRRTEMRRMSSYWISEDWKVKVETLESYLRNGTKNGAYDYAIRATEDESGNVQFYIHPQNADGDTIDYKVTGNSLYPADPAFHKPELGRFFAFMRMGDDYKIANLEGFTAHINALERLYTAMKRDDQEAIQAALAELKEQDEELGEDEDEQCSDCEDGVFTGRDDGGMYCETCGRRDEK